MYVESVDFILYFSSCFANQGEICLCTSRLFVQRTIYERFITQFVSAATTLIVGDPEDKRSDLGAVISIEHRKKIASYVELAKRTNAQVLCGDETIQLNETKHEV